MRSFMINLVDMALRSIAFGVPVAFVAHWCGVEPTWKTIALVAFCIIWADCVAPKRDQASSPAKPEEPSDNGNRRAAAAILTPAQVAYQARKLTPHPLR
jgi:hypothetical protein